MPLSQGELVRIGNVPFELREPHTLESVREDAGRAEDYKPWRCRRGWHQFEVIGAVHIPDDVIEGTLAVIASSDTGALVRCKRCGVIRTEGRY